jgi:hypothetical protein
VSRTVSSTSSLAGIGSELRLIPVGLVLSGSVDSERAATMESPPNLDRHTRPSDRACELDLTHVVTFTPFSLKESPAAYAGPRHCWWRAQPAWRRSEFALCTRGWAPTNRERLGG